MPGSIHCRLWKASASCGRSETRRILQLTTTMREEDSNELSCEGDEIWTDPDMIVGGGGAWVELTRQGCT